VVVLGIPLLVALSGTAAAQALYDTRLGNYGVLSALTIARALGVVIAQVTWGLMDPSLAALIVPTILFSGVPLVRLIWLIRQNSSPKHLSCRAFLVEYRKYPICRFRSDREYPQY
jgi:Co/Zn/Cd efflux system component